MKKYKIKFLPVTIFDSFSESQDIFRKMLNEKKQHLISFVNPEIFLQAEKNPFLRMYLQRINYNFVDGIGLLMAINKKIGSGYGSKDRYPGTDFFKYLPTEQPIRVFLFGASEENSVLASKNIQEEFHNITICGRLNGFSERSDDEIIALINEKSPDILIVCLGCPNQESWILYNKNKINTKIIFGNGGSIDFWSGKIKRAPKFMIEHGFEWLFRLGQDFSYKRIKRQMKLIVFLLRLRLGKIPVEEIEV